MGCESGTPSAKRRSRATFEAALAIAALHGCGKTVDTTVPEVEDPVAVHEAGCQRIAGCFPERFELYADGTLESCLRIARCSSKVSARTYESGCADAIAAASCDESTLEACEPRGNVGDACNRPGAPRCADDLYCKPIGEFSIGGCGHCTVRGDVGDACTLDSCAQGLFCNQETERCETPRGLGEFCSLGAGACAPGLYCNWDTDVCEERPTVGEPCPGGGVCTGTICRDGLCTAQSPLGGHCESAGDCEDATERRCTDGICRTLGDTGDACSLASNSRPCREGLACVDGRCTPLPCGRGELGDPCGGSDCRSGLFCHSESRRCTEVAELGQPCENTTCAEGTFCASDTGLCIAQKADGAACAGSRECLSDYCESVSNTEPLAYCASCD